MLGSDRRRNRNRAFKEKASYESQEHFKELRKEGETEHNGIHKVHDAEEPWGFFLKISRNQRPFIGGESYSKRQKISDNLRFMEKARGGGGWDGVDRISNLMDDVMGHILLFVTTKDALRTCVLSTRWEKYWMLTKNLDFEYEEFCDEMTTDPISNIENQLKFKRCVTRVIQLTNNISLRRFSLKFIVIEHRLNNTDWVLGAVDSVLSRGIRELDVNINLPNNEMWRRLPSTLLLLTNLEVLKLGSFYLLEVPCSFCLPKLKILSLNNIRFPDDQSFNRLLLSCPVLEDLSLSQQYINKSPLNVSAPSLKTFSLVVTCEFRDGIEDVFLDTPHLESLDIACRFLVKFKHPHNLVRAKLGIAYDGEEWISFLNQINYVPCLCLAGVPLRNRSVVPVWPEFPNLTYLCVGTFFSRDGVR